MKDCGFLLVGGSEDSILLWDTNFRLTSQTLDIHPIMELKKDDFYRGMSLLDLEDGENLVCGDWDGNIYIWNFL